MHERLPPLDLHGPKTKESPGAQPGLCMSIFHSVELAPAKKNPPA